MERQNFLKKWWKSECRHWPTHHAHRHLSGRGIEKGRIQSDQNQMWKGPMTGSTSQWELHGSYISWSHCTNAQQCTYSGTRVTPKM